MTHNARNKHNNGHSSSLGTLAIKAMRKAVRRARRTARLNGVPIHIWRDGKAVIDRN